MIEPREPRGRDADDGEGDAVEPDRAAEHRGVGAELAHPEVVAEHDDGIAAGHLIFVGPNPRPSSGSSPSRGKVAAHQHPIVSFGDRVGFTGNPTTGCVNAISPSNVLLRSRRST